MQCVNLKPRGALLIPIWSLKNFSSVELGSQLSPALDAFSTSGAAAPTMASSHTNC